MLGCRRFFEFQRIRRGVQGSQVRVEAGGREVVVGLPGGARSIWL